MWAYEAVKADLARRKDGTRTGPSGVAEDMKQRRDGNGIGLAMSADEVSPDTFADDSLILTACLILAWFDPWRTANSCT